MMERKLITVHISGHLRDYIGNKRDFETNTSKDVLELVYQLNKMFPGIRDRIFDDQDQTREYVNIFVNGENVRDMENEMTKLKDGDLIHVLPSVAGGWN